MSDNIEIERKFLVKELPESLSMNKFHVIEQGYLCTNPVVRIRKEDNRYYLTYKGKGQMLREEYNLPLTKRAYEKLRTKIDGILIRKTRYIIPINNSSINSNLQIELDIFEEPYKGLYIAEVEFPNESEALHFIPPDWFTRDVTYDKRYHNSFLSKGKQE